MKKNGDNNKEENDDIEFQVTDWEQYHEDEEEDEKVIRKYKIRMYGTTRENKKIFVKVNGYTPYFFVEIPREWNRNERKIKLLIDGLKEKVSIDHKESLKKYDIVKRHNFWEFTNYKLDWYLRLIFHSHEGMRAYERILNRELKIYAIENKPRKYKLYESNIEPLLRCAHIRKINLCGWIKINKNKYKKYKKGEEPTYNEINIETNWTELNPIEENTIMPLTIASFDIECTSEDGSFPQPQRDGDKIIQIATTISRYGQEECYYKNIITLGSCDKIDGVDVESYENEIQVLLAWTKLIQRTNPDIITGYNIFGFDFRYLEARSKKLGCYSSFSNLGRIKNEKSPFIEKILSSSALGTNELYYYAMQGRVQIDLMKVIQRDFKLPSYKLDNVASEFIREIIKDLENNEQIVGSDTKKKEIIDEITQILEKNIKEIKANKNKKKIKEITEKLENELEQLGQKQNIKIDTKKLLEKILDYKEKEYEFKNVIEEMVDEIEMFEEDSNEGETNIITKNTYGIEPDRYIKIYINDGLSDNSYQNEKKYKVKEIIKKAKQINGQDYDILKVEGKIEKELMEYKKNKIYWCQAKDDVSPQEIFSLQKGSSKDRARIAKYCVNDSVLCNKLINKLHIITNNIGMANVCHVPLSYIFLRGQGIKIFSLVSKKCRERDHVIPVIRKPNNNNNNFKTKEQQKVEEITAKIQVKTKDKGIFESEEEEEDTGYEGATVFHPNKGIHFDPITVLDYNSLYPNSMIFVNISHECIVKDERYDNLPDYDYRTVVSTYNGTETTSRYAKSKDGKMGIIPEILKELLDARARMKDLMEKETDPFKKKILDGLQLAYKIVANSVYGQCGSPVSPIYMKEIASSTTATGREMLNVARIFAENILPLIINAIMNGEKDNYLEIMDRLFKKQIDELLGEKIVAYLQKEHQMYDIWGKPMIFDKDKKLGELVLEKKGQIIVQEATYKYLRILKENMDEINETYPKFIDRKLNHKTKTDFIEWLYVEVKRIMKDKIISPRVIYGDSVTQATPILLRQNGKVIIKRIDEIGKNWTEYNQFKLEDQTLKGKQQDNNINYEVWTDKGWSKIKRVIRHFTNKEIYRICTHTGVVDVTEDHSLLTNKGELIKPIDCKIDVTKLLHSYPEHLNCKNNKLGLRKSLIYGFFLGDGSCGKYNTKYGIKYQWYLCNVDYKLLEKLKKILEMIYKGDKFKILDTLKSSGVYKLVPIIKIKKFFEEYRNIFYDSKKHKIVPMDILNGTLREKESFMEGYYIADGCRKDTENIGCHRFDIKSQNSASNMYYLIKSMGYNASINTRKDKMKMYRINYTKGKLRKDPEMVKKIYNLGKINNYVYDLETEVGHFHAGIGQIIVKNTDSIFINFRIRDEEENNLDEKITLQTSIDLGQICSKLLHKILPSPQNMAYEKSYYPFVILSKKRYVGNKYETNTEYYSQNSMGISLKRRDNAQIVKIAVGGIVKSILNEKSKEGAIEFIKTVLKKMIKDEYDMDKFIITKTLKGNAMTEKERIIENSKPKEERKYADRTRIVHVVLADRMADRDPGNRPASNDRIPFAYIITNKKTKLQGEKVEHPEYIIQNKLKLDYLFYIIHQIQKPAIQFLQYLMDEPNKIFEKIINKELNKRKGAKPVNHYFNKKLVDYSKNNNLPLGFTECDSYDFIDSEKSSNKKSNDNNLSNHPDAVSKNKKHLEKNSINLGEKQQNSNVCEGFMLDNDELFPKKKIIIEKKKVNNKKSQKTLKKKCESKINNILDQKFTLED